MPILHPSGGLIYHLRAWRWRRTLWAPFHDQVRRWLTDWRPDMDNHVDNPVDHLVLVGPSGGYALSRPFLERFRRLTVLEPDPLARRILAHRFPDCRFVWENAPRLAEPDGFRLLAECFPDAAFLFCNLLGQTPVGGGAGFDRRAWLDSLEPSLAGRAWASWHDLASTDRPPDLHDALAFARSGELETVLGHYGRGGELEIHDHGCAGLCPEHPRQYVIWHLAPGRYHLIEWFSRVE
jgi:hypothetical protein